MIWLAKPSPSAGKKLKKRLEDLERRAGSSDGASSPGEKASSGSTTKSTKRPQTQQQQAKTPKAASAAPVKSQSSQGQFTPPMHHEDEYLFPQSYENERERSFTPPMHCSPYPQLSSEGTLLHHSYPTTQTYRPQESYGYLTPGHSTLPTLPPIDNFEEAIKRESASFPDSFSYLSYGAPGGYLPSMSGMGMSAAAHPAPYDHLPHVSSSSRSPHPHHPYHHHQRDLRRREEERRY